MDGLEQLKNNSRFDDFPNILRVTSAQGHWDFPMGEGALARLEGSDVTATACAGVWEGGGGAEDKSGEIHGSFYIKQLKPHGPSFIDLESSLV